MLPNPNLYGHHGYNAHNAHQDQPWMHSQPNHQHQAQQVSLTQAQQQHYNRLANSHNNAATSMAVSAAAHVQDSGLENVSEDNRRTLSYIADLLSENTREAALLELSKKREQVPELALILWHSFGTFPTAPCTAHGMRRQCR